MAANFYRRDLCKLFNRFKKGELFHGLAERGILEGGSMDTSGTKKAFVNRILELCFGENATADNVATMDLLYHQTHPSCKKWTILTLTGFEPEKQSYILDPQEFKNRMRSFLELYFKVDICVQLWKGTMWTRLHICEGPSNSLLHNTVFIVYYPHSAYIFITAIKAAYKQYILQMLSSLLHCQSLEEVKLTGRDVISLKELVLNKSSQGAFSKYRHNQVDVNPLSRKRKREKADEKVETQSHDVTSDETHEVMERQQITDNAFGCNPQPRLERVEFKMQTRLQCQEHIPLNPKRTISCAVKFEGPSVLEGIKNLGQQSYVDVPLPSYLANLHSLSKNSFVLREKKTVEIDGDAGDQSCTVEDMG